MRLRSAFRLLLIAILAIFSGPPMALAAAGEWVVICDASGGARQVLYDFETGAPVENAPDSDAGWGRCDLCLACEVAADLWDDGAYLGWKVGMVREYAPHASAPMLRRVAKPARSPPV